MKFLVVIMALFSTITFADEVKVSCKMSDLKHIPQFELESSFDTNENSFTDKKFEISLRSRGNDGESRDISSIRDGSITVYEGNIITKKPFMFINSVDQGSDIHTMTLLNDYPGSYNSFIRLETGHVYYSTCKTSK